VTETFDATPAVELLVELIRNACVNTGEETSGGEIRSVRSIQSFLGMTGTVVEPLPGRASVVFRHAGSDPSAPRLLLVPHLDVVPADSTDWTHDPFSGTRSEGFVWGRGAVDMLNVTAAMVTLFRGLVSGVLPPSRGDVILAAVADEEAGGTYGAAELVASHWNLVACDAVLTEVAGPMIGRGDNMVIPVTVAEKGPAWRQFTAKGVPGHGSQPYRRSNAVLTLSAAFDRIGRADNPSLITDEWRAFVGYLPVSAELQDALCDEQTLDAAIDTVAESDEVLARWIHACTHLTFSPNTLTGGTKSNMVPDVAVGDVDVRLLPGQDRSDVEDHLRKVLGADLFDQLEINPILEMTANGSPASGTMWEAIGDAARIHTGSRDLAPTLTPVTTDARFFRELGIPSYGVGLFDDTVTFPEMLAMFHGIDERVSEQSVIDTTAFLATVVERFSARAGTET
jgi:acetylornithine deacetylase/succinyl-diaminopimelate desuccinylase-like protein